MIKRILQWALPIVFLLVLMVCAFRVWYYPDTQVCGTVNPNTVSTYQTTGKYPSWQLMAVVDFGTEKTWRNITQADLAHGTFCKRVSHVTVFDYMGMLLFSLIVIVSGVIGIAFGLGHLYGSDEPTTRAF